MSVARVVVAEDDDESRAALCEILREAGYVAVGARDGVELIELVAAFRPEAALADLAMPRLNGLEAAASIRRAAETAGTRLIAVSASWLADRSDLMAAAGFDGALRKPFTGSQLLAELDRVLAPAPEAQAMVLGGAPSIDSYEKGRTE